MAEENLEIVRASFDAWNAGDMDAYGELMADDVVTSPPEGWPEPGPFVGREAAIREFELIRDSWDGADVARPKGELVQAGARVVGRLTWQGQGRGPAASTEMSCVYTVQDGKLARMDFFWDHRRALEWVGLAE